MKNMLRIALGDKVQDRISKFRGIVTARIEYLHDTTRFIVTPEVNDNKFSNGESFTEGRLVIVDDSKVGYR